MHVAEFHLEILSKYKMVTCRIALAPFRLTWRPFARPVHIGGLRKVFGSRCFARIATVPVYRPAYAASCQPCSLFRDPSITLRSTGAPFHAASCYRRIAVGTLTSLSTDRRQRLLGQYWQLLQRKTSDRYIFQYRLRLANLAAGINRHALEVFVLLRRNGFKRLRDLLLTRQWPYPCARSFARAHRY